VSDRQMRSPQSWKMTLGQKFRGA